MALNYIGSKKQLLSWIEETINSHLSKPFSQTVFCDLFAGTHSVGKHFSKKVRKVISNDLECYSNIIGKAELVCQDVKQDFLKELNQLPPVAGKISSALCEGGAGERLYFSKENGQRIDSIRTAIDSGNLTDTEKQVAVCSLLYAADKVANTTSVYGAFLKKIKKSACKEILLVPLDLSNAKVENEVFCSKAEELIKTISGDILYLDPPYNGRQYGANYHVLNTIALNDTEELRGKTGLRKYSSSKLCSKKEALLTLGSIVKDAKFSIIALSYSSEGIMKRSDIEAMLRRYGNLTVYEKPYKTYVADSKRDNKSTQLTEFLFLLEKK